MGLKNSDEVILQLYGYMWKITKSNSRLFNGVRIPQSVIINSGEILAWYFNGQNGEFLIKRRQNLNFKHLRRRFMKGRYIPAKKFYERFIHVFQKKEDAEEAVLNIPAVSVRNTEATINISHNTTSGATGGFLGVRKSTMPNPISSTHHSFNLMDSTGHEHRKSRMTLSQSPQITLNKIKQNVVKKAASNPKTPLFKPNDPKMQLKNYLLTCYKGVFKCTDVVLKEKRKGQIVAYISVDKLRLEISQNHFEIYFNKRVNMAYYINLDVEETHRKSPKKGKEKDNVVGGSQITSKGSEKKYTQTKPSSVIEASKASVRSRKASLGLEHAILNEEDKPKLKRSDLVFMDEEKFLSFCLQTENESGLLLVQKIVSPDVNCLSKFSKLKIKFFFIFLALVNSLLLAVFSILWGPQLCIGERINYMTKDPKCSEVDEIKKLQVRENPNSKKSTKKLILSQLSSDFLLKGLGTSGI